MALQIKPEDLPGANLATDVRLSAGRGWLPLVCEALADVSDLEILAIREDAGALVIDTTRGSAAQRERLAEIRAASLHVCELCGLPGELVYEGAKDGRPAGWHRTRCAAHRDWRTSPQGQQVVRCDVCDASTAESGHGVLQAQWRDGEAEGMRLCRSCFGYAVAALREAHRANHMFDDGEPEPQEKE